MSAEGIVSVGRVVAETFAGGGMRFGGRKRLMSTSDSPAVGGGQVVWSPRLVMEEVSAEWGGVSTRLESVHRWLVEWTCTAVE